MLEDKVSIFISHRIEAKEFKNIDEVVSGLSKEFGTDNQNMYIVRKQIKASIKELLKYDVVMMGQ